MNAMDLLLHLDRTLDELDAPCWPAPPADATRLIRTVHELRRVPLRELRPTDLRMLTAQQVALSYVVPLAVRLLLEENGLVRGVVTGVGRGRVPCRGTAAGRKRNVSPA